MEIWVIVILALAVLTVVVAVVLYNRLVRLRNAYRTSFSQIDVLLKLRHDLVPNLVSTVQGYATHERSVLTEVTQARQVAETARQKVSASGTTGSVGELARAEKGLTGALGRLMMVAEAYPDLKAQTNFLHLQEELTTIEGRISYARRAYNQAVEDYNNAVETVPSNLIAGPAGFVKTDLLDFEDRAEIQKAPAVSFG